MASRGRIDYRGATFQTVLEARWAVFFTALDQDWHYAADGWPLGNPEHYQPQLLVMRSDVQLYLEVRAGWDRHTRRPMLYAEPEIEDHHVYLAAGELPDQKQLRRVGWWDNGQGVLQLTAGWDFAQLYPPGNDDILAALETAREETFELPMPTPRREARVTRDIKAERERRRQ